MFLVCQCCKRALSNPISMLRGYGPECAQRLGIIGSMGGRERGVRFSRQQRREDGSNRPTQTNIWDFFVHLEGERQCAS